MTLDSEAREPAAGAALGTIAAIDLTRHAGVRSAIRYCAAFALIIGACALLFLLVPLFDHSAIWRGVLGGLVGIGLIRAGLAAGRGSRTGVTVVLVAWAVACFAAGAACVGRIVRVMTRGQIGDWWLILVLAALVGLAFFLLSCAAWYWRDSGAALLFPEVAAQPSLRERWRGVWLRLRGSAQGRRVPAILWLVAAFPLGLVVFSVLSVGLQLSESTALGRLPRFFWDLMGGYVLMGTVWLVFAQVRRGLQYITRSAAQVRAADQRAPILFLRSFDDDKLNIQRETNLFWGIFETLLPLRLDEFLQKSLQAFGPVVAIGRPREALSPHGAAREYVPDEVWRQTVEARIRESQLVVAIAGRTDGIAWEMAAVSRLSAGHKLIVVMPPMLRAKQARERWLNVRTGLGKGVAEAELPKKMALVFQAGGLWQAATLSWFRRDAGGYRIALTRAHVSVRSP